MTLQTHTHKKTKKTMVAQMVADGGGGTDGQADGQTDGPTNTARCRVACPRLKLIRSFLNLGGTMILFNLYCNEKIVMLVFSKPNFGFFRFTFLR